MLVDLIQDRVEQQDVQQIISVDRGYPGSYSPMKRINSRDESMLEVNDRGVFATPNNGATLPERVLVSGYDLPVGIISMWSGTVASLAGTAWRLCDGLNGTPDLRDRFIVGAGGALAAGATGGLATLSLAHNHAGAPHTHSHAHAGAAHSHSHSHSGAAHSHSHAHTPGVHSHAFEHDHASVTTNTESLSVSINQGTGALVTVASNLHTHAADLPSHNGTTGWPSPDITGSDATGATFSDNTGPDAAAAAFSGNTGSDATGAAFSANTGDALGNADNRPPYFSLAYIMKTA